MLVDMTAQPHMSYVVRHDKHRCRARDRGCECAVHLSPLPCEIPQAPGAAGTLCGALLPFDQVETVGPGAGMPCGSCTQDLDDTPSWTVYQDWGWPVVVSGDRVLLVLDDSVTALALPRRLVDEIVPILVSRDRQPAILSHSAAPDHPILLVGEPFGVPLPWPADVHAIYGAVPLPPTPLGLVDWLQPPHSSGLANCREIDVFGAVRTTSLTGARGNGGGS